MPLSDHLKQKLMSLHMS